MTYITELPLDQAARDLAKAQSSLMIKSFARDLVESCQEYGLEAAADSIPSVVGPRAISELLIETLRDQVDKPGKCVVRLVTLLEDHLEETNLYREQLGLAYRSLARAGTIEVGDSLGELRVRLGEGVAKVTSPPRGHERGADRSEGEM